MEDNPWSDLLTRATSRATELQDVVGQLTELHDETVAKINKYVRQGAGGGMELDLEAIRATPTRPYTLIPINEKESTLIHWRGVKMPIFGWVVKQEPAFTISRVSRGMELLTPFPAWMKEELGWRAPDHAAIIEGDRTSVRVTQGNQADFKRKYGRHLGASLGDNSFKIKPGDAWIRLISELIRDGILPWVPQPVAKADWKSHTPRDERISLREYQKPLVEEFFTKGAVFFNLPPGAGKTMIALYIIDFIVGKCLILAPSIILCEQWRERVKQYAPFSDVTILTYASGKKALKTDWSLVVFDEVQTLPADTFSKLAFLKTKYRIGLSASPWREDGRQYMITALSGFPCAIRWADLIRAGVLKRPRVVIATVATETDKTAFTRQLIDKRKGGRVLIFCDYLQAGQELADNLDIPFVSGSSTGTSARKLAQVTESEVCVVSRIADRGLDFQDLTLVIEWAFMGKSREQEAQRLGRLLHSQAKGEHYLLFTPQEAEKFKPRIFGIESELAGEIDLEFITVGKVAERRQERAITVRKSKPRLTAAMPDDVPADDISRVMAMRPIAVKIYQAEKSIGASSTPYVRRAFRWCFSAPLSPDEIADGRGITGSVARSRISSACKALEKAGLLIKDGQRYVVSKSEIKRAKVISSLVEK